MRFTPAFFLPAALALAHCSSPVPATPDAAWVVNLSSNGPPCTISNSSVHFATSDVNPTSIQAHVSDQQVVMGQTATVNCAVSPVTGGFEVQGHAEIGSDTLTITIPKIDKTATKDAPAVGTVTYESSATVARYSSDMCKFYFGAGTPQSIDAGKVWLTFTCDGLSDGMGMNSSVCPVIESYAAFESCGTSPLN